MTAMRLRRMHAPSWALVALLALALSSTGAGAKDAADGSASDAAAGDAAAATALESLVPEVAAGVYGITPGPRPYQNRISVSPSYGQLGHEPIFSLRIAYNPNSWLGYEGSLGHNPGESVHAVLHTLSAVVRRPLPGRFQPYAKAGYGMLMVSPGPSLNADPVTKNALTVGGGVEVYIRNDVALRAESQLATVIGGERGQSGTVAYNYSMHTIGLAFYRTVAP